jgi:hypothetical protein
MSEAIKKLENRNPKMAEMVKKLSETKGELFDLSNLSYKEDDGGYSVGFNETKSWIYVDKDDVIRGESGGTGKEGCPLNEFFNGMKLLPNATYKVNGGFENAGVDYYTDFEGRTCKYKANITDMTRSKIEISKPYDPTKEMVRQEIQDYDAGHLVAKRFKGCNCAINLVAMPASVNRSGGDWCNFEEEVYKLVKAGKNVIIEGEIKYEEPNPKIVTSIKLRYNVDKEIKDKEIDFKKYRKGLGELNIKH